MDKFTALLQVVLALLGLDVGGQTLVHRIDSATAGLYSRTHVEAGIARFECLRSASGQCHYVLYPDDCAVAAGAMDARCAGAPLERFALASGNSRRVVGFADFRLCVGADGDPAHAECQAF